MKRYLVGCVCVLIAAGAVGEWLLALQPILQQAPLSENTVLMRAKLSSSQKVLEGILAEDFTLIAHGAREMKKISEAAEWPRSRDPVYEHFAAEFRRQCIKLESLANKTNREGVDIHLPAHDDHLYQLSRSCARCSTDRRACPMGAYS